MISFLLRRFLAAIPLLLDISLLAFLLMYLSPGDSLSEARASRDISQEFIQQLERERGLDQPWYVQYGRWLGRAAQGDFGYSWTYKTPVSQLLGQRVQATLLLSISALVLAWLAAVPLGVFAAIKKDGLFDRASSLFAYAAISIPSFFLALLAVFLAAKTGWFPTGGRTALDYEFLSPAAQYIDILKHLCLPVLVLAVGGVAGMMRVMRANFLDDMRAQYVTTARAKGVPEGRVMFVHVLRNAINPLITSLGFALSGLLSGAVLVENVMNYPGLGQLIYDAIVRKDQDVVLAAVTIGCVMLLLGNLLADVLLAASDPRIRLEKTANLRLDKKRLRAIGIGAAAILLLILAGTLLAHAPAAVRNIILYLGAAILALAGIACVSILAWVIWKLIRRLWRALLRRPWGLASLSALALLYTLALFAPWVAPYSAELPNLEKAYHPPTALHWKDGRLCAQVYQLADAKTARYEPISGECIPLTFFSDGKLLSLDTDNPHARVYLLGADGTGRDVFSRLLYGARISLSIGLVGISITFVMGFLVGGLAGYFGGLTDFFSMRGVEFIMAIPSLYLLLGLRAALAPHFDSGEMFLLIILILSFIGWAGTARVIRGMALSLRQRPYVLAAQAMGASTPRILIKHFLPNLASYLLVAATLSIPGYILGEAALSFLGLGIQEPSASWGLMLKDAQQLKIFMLGLWWMFLPGAAIFLTVISFNLLGDVLRDIIDPQMKL